MNEARNSSMHGLFLRAVELLSEFNREKYENAFKDFFAQQKSLLDELLQICKEDKTEEIISVIPDFAKQNLDKLQSKADKMTRQTEYNMAMAVYVFPLFVYQREPQMEQLAKDIAQYWNRIMSQSVKVSEYETVSGGFKRRLCYITTAVCESLGKTDECYELNLLRNYRDGYLLEECGERARVREYYSVAPTIVKRIDRMENAKEIYKNIWDTYLSSCISCIEEGRKQECEEIYSDMVKALEKEYLYS